MFMGEYAHTIDKKGRIIIPAKMREELGTCCVITKGSDGCLNVYTQEQWNTIYEQLMKLPMTKKETRLYVRKLAGKARCVEFDSQGRVLVPNNLVEIAHLEKDCMIVGCGNHIEIWNYANWEEMDALSEEKFEEIEEQLTEYLL